MKHPFTRGGVVVVIAFVALSLGAMQDMPGPKVGDTAPPVSLENLHGQNIVLTNMLKDSQVVVLFLRGYPGYQCPICSKQVGAFVAAADQFKEAGAKVIMIYPGPSDALKAHADEFIKGKGLPDGFELVIDPDYTATNAWKLRWDAPKETAYPATYVVGTDGIISFAKASKTHGDRATVAQVMPALKKQ